MGPVLHIPVPGTPEYCAALVFPQKHHPQRHCHYGGLASAAGYAEHLLWQNSNLGQTPPLAFKSLCHEPLEDGMRKRITLLVGLGEAPWERHKAITRGRTVRVFGVLANRQL